MVGVSWGNHGHGPQGEFKTFFESLDEQWRSGWEDQVPLRLVVTANTTPSEDLGKVGISIGPESTLAQISVELFGDQDVRISDI